MKNPNVRELIFYFGASFVVALVEQFFLMGFYVTLFPVRILPMIVTMGMPVLMGVNVYWLRRMTLSVNSGEQTPATGD